MVVVVEVVVVGAVVLALVVGVEVSAGVCCSLDEVLLSGIVLALLTSAQGIVTVAGEPRIDGITVVKLTGLKSDIVSLSLVLAIPLRKASAGETVVTLLLSS